MPNKCRDCADHDGICPNFGTPCDPADVLVEMRSAHPPYKTWRELGHLPFDMFDEGFAVTRNVGGLDSPLKWRVSHVATGIAIPHTASETKELARDAARNALRSVGRVKFKAALTRARETIAEGRLPA